ncbi:hypothetical protein LP316_00520 [Thalassotalea sp. LPB0316]|uniref:hypothetical protein n=1 Tax=Thalassotalea sp. LPB0316 TaxID=2769490 RepID=UPI0018693639|nr:hypothetical protein [Thalassotalea sp. LPB0316]QOL25843.1 hypothetical protein LP316_00520 [Thalassotalea sp. LPB0316]
MRELSVNEVEAVNGGNDESKEKSSKPKSKLAKIIAVGEVIYDELSSIDWGDSMDDPDTNLAP